MLVKVSISIIVGVGFDDVLFPHLLTVATVTPRRFATSLTVSLPVALNLAYECSFAVSIVAFIEINFTVIFSTSELTGGDAAQRNRRPVERLGHLT